MLSGKNFFITGATGYLGSRIVHKLAERGNKIYCLHRKSSNLSILHDIESKIIWVNIEQFNYDTFFLINHVDAIIHCATNYGRKEESPLSTIEANLILPLKLLHAASEANAPSFFNTDTVLDKCINNYSLSKSQFVDWLKTFSDRINCVNIALQHFYGPGDDPTKFVTFIIKSLLREEQCIKLTDGKQRRDFIFIDDAVEAILKIIEAYEQTRVGFHRFEVGSGESTTIREFVMLIKKLCNNTNTFLDFGALPYRKGEVMDVYTNIEELLSLGWMPKINLLSGIEQTIKIEREIIIRNNNRDNL